MVGNGLPKLQMSVTHTFRYKNLDLNLYFEVIWVIRFMMSMICIMACRMQLRIRMCWSPLTRKIGKLLQEKNVHSSYFCT